MDPDMVRQQAEAEREALALLRKKPAAASIAHAIPADAAQGAGPVPHEEAAALHAAAALAAPAAIPLEKQPPAPQAGPAPRRASPPAAQVGRFISLAFAGAMLGGGLGILAASFMHLPPDAAKLAVFGPAAFFAGVCAMAVFFTKPSRK